MESTVFTITLDIINPSGYCLASYPGLPMFFNVCEKNREGLGTRLITHTHTLIHTHTHTHTSITPSLPHPVHGSVAVGINLHEHDGHLLFVLPFAEDLTKGGFELINIQTITPVLVSLL